MTKHELEERVADLEQENDDLHSRLDAVMDIVRREVDGDQGHNEGGEEDDD